MKKNISLVVALIIIVGVIWYLQSLRVSSGGNNSSSSAVSVTLPTDESIATSSTSSTGKLVKPTMKLSDVISRDKAKGYQPATEIAGPTGFVNTPPFKLSDIVGKKVILVDFWTYSCINCLRTLPYLTSWYQKYKDAGLEIVGIHTPEFEFEKDINNVKAAAAKYGITYPIVLDSDHATWNAYGNLYWPHEYLIDIAGYVVHDHIGEGGYDETEGLIQNLLGDRSAVLGTAPLTSTSTTVVAPDDLSDIGSPETYFGSARNQYLANGNAMTPGVQTLTEPASVNLNKLNLSGTWNFSDEFATNNSSDAKIIYKYNSSKVFFVGSATNGTTVEVLQDGKPVTSAAGSDVKDGEVTIKESRLYNIINNPDGAGEHTLELIIKSPGLHAYTFTFG